MTQYHIAQLNVAKLEAPIDSPQLADFVANLDRINALADDSPGFVWRLQTEDGDATGIDYFGSDQIVNLSVWESVEALHDYVYRSVHVEIMRRKKEWFHKLAESHMVLWWVPAGHIPSLEEASEKLQRLRKSGPTNDAFTFKKTFPPATEAVEISSNTLGGECPAT
ncbi:DUF3291 domain-containing protein [Marinobacter sp. M216]|uniref:DUF3291 domain-containing protein n=1 Tax=Marinobacter albus TaxID=3030833 RepID=A0ABT7HFT7_9GAMM|nr:DUF3291 domain-containing protein [Marinobacter sp. M216]MDK9559231.1 DUF3291 domain-containing protein [Marinobacter sp. M216]